MLKVRRGPDAADRQAVLVRKEATRPPGLNSLQQQGCFDAFVHEFNAERPHEALGMKCPAQLYAASPRRYDGLPDLTYPFHDRDILATACGRLCLRGRRDLAAILHRIGDAAPVTVGTQESGAPQPQLRL